MIINSIRSKKVDPRNGDLEEINEKLFDRFNPEIISGFLDKKDSCKKTLISNQLQNIRGILELAGINLEFSCEKYVKSFCEKHYPDKKDNINLREKISGDFILNSIIYYNASFDYIRALLRLIYSSYDDLKRDYEREKIEGELRRLELEEGDWFLALGSLITRQGVRDFFVWLRNNDGVSSKIKGIFKKLRDKNEKLRKNYQANQLKHGAIPCFGKTDESNMSNSRYLITLEQFYKCENSIKIIKGFHRNLLKIDETQRFLIDYHNETVDFLNFLSEN